MKKADFILIISILIVAALFSIVFLFIPGDNASYIIITVDGNLYDKLYLNTDDTITIKQDGYTNTLEIKNKKAQMISANCRDLICVNQNPIGLDGETIICLPHKIVIEAKSSENKAPDALAGINFLRSSFYDKENIFLWTICSFGNIIRLF